jgi:lipopolysaccharide heptosyltransferase II
LNKEISWRNINRVLVVRLRSIGDTVLTTPSLIALRRFLPEAQIDILLEEWVAPVLDGFAGVDNVLTVTKQVGDRVKVARNIRREKYDLVFNLHGGTTATFFVRASGARHRVGYSGYSYSFLYNHRLTSSSDFWQREPTHSAEQQLALLGFLGIPVNDRPKTRLTVSEPALLSVSAKLESKLGDENSKLALFHPAAAFETKRWGVEKFAEIAGFLGEKGFQVVAVAGKNERNVLEDLKKHSSVPIAIFDDLELSEITALASKSKLFVGNDSGIAHIAAAVQTPEVVIFGSSNRAHWSPWTSAPSEMVFNELPCQPCAGYSCKQFEEPKCILQVETMLVKRAIEKVLID